MSFTSLFSRIFARFTGSGVKAPDAQDPVGQVQPEWLIVGLGNPGAEYAATAHNAGYLVVDKLLDATGARWQRRPGVPAKVALAEELAFVRADSYMNLSGEAVARAAGSFGIPVERVVVIHDELDAQPGVVRLKVGGGENGHNGLKSTSVELGSRDYARIKVGIGRPMKGVSVVDHVLGELDWDAEPLSSALERAAEMVLALPERGITGVQNTFH